MQSFNVNLTTLSILTAFCLIPYFAFRRIQQAREAAEFAAKHHCLPARKLIARYPFGLDHVFATVAAAREKQVLRFFVGVVEHLGLTFEQSLLGERGFGTAEPKNLEALLSSKFTSFGLGTRFPVLGPLLGDGIFTQDGDSWRHSREMLRPLFSGNRVDTFLQIQEHVEALIACIPEGKVIDFQPLFFRFTLDTSTYLLFGRNINTLGTPTPLSEAFAESFRVAQDFLAQRGRMGPFYWTIGGKAFRRACATVHEFVDDTIQKALSDQDLDKGFSLEQASKYGFLGTLLEETQEPKALRDQLLNMLIAGRDTTACCLTWAMRLLAMHENVLSKLRNEIQEKVGIGSEARRPDRTDLKKMTYLNYVVKEVLRLYPSVPLNSRAALVRTSLPTGGGPDGTAPIMINKGETVGYSVYVMHRRKDLYGSDADEFRPERWDPNESNEVSLKNIGYGYLPFNGGPRICLGQDFAIVEASYTIVRLLQTFREFEYDPHQKMVKVGDERQDVTLVLAPVDGCHIRVRS